MPASKPSKYFITLLIIALTTVIQKLLWPWVDPAPYLLFYPAVMIASLYGDGILAIILSVLCVQYFFIPPYNSLAMDDLGDYIRCGVFMVSGFAIRMNIRKLMEETFNAERAVNLLRQRERDLEKERDTREKFVATLTHDLQTPLTAVKLNLQLAQRTKELPDGATVKLKKAEGSLVRMENMIRDLLDVNSIRAGRALPLELSECHLNEVADDAVSELKQIYGDRFHVRHTEDLRGYWSCQGLRRIIENLCSNAAKYGAENGPVKVVLGKGDGKAILEVHNEGPPIPESAQKVLFNPYERAHEQAGKKKGHGLGLTLVKGLAEAQGGEVTVSSREGLGTTFTVSLPLDARLHASQKSFT